jgi:hypothetical protein
MALVAGRTAVWVYMMRMGPKKGSDIINTVVPVAARHTYNRNSRCRQLFLVWDLVTECVSRRTPI